MLKKNIRYFKILEMIIKPLLNISNNKIQTACIELGKKIGHDINPRVSFNVDEFNGKAYMSVQKLLSENKKGIFLKFTQGNDNASILIAKGKDQNLKNFIPNSHKIVNKKLANLISALQKADRDEAKSLTNF